MTVSTVEPQDAEVPKPLQKLVLAGTVMVIAFGLMLAVMMFWVPGIAVVMAACLMALATAGVIEENKFPPRIHWSIVAAVTAATTAVGILMALDSHSKFLRDGSIYAAGYNFQLLALTIVSTCFGGFILTLLKVAVYAVFDMVRTVVLRIIQSLQA